MVLKTLLYARREVGMDESHLHSRGDTSAQDA